MSGQLEARTKKFAVAVIRFFTSLPNNEVARVLGRQLLRSGTSIGANYREAMYGRSPAEFISKCEIALQEASETTYWLELFTESDTVPAEQTAGLLNEAGQLKAMLIASINTAKARR